MMTDFLSIAALWIGFALVAAILSSTLGIAAALCEIVVGVLAQSLIQTWHGGHPMPVNEPWVTFLATIGAIMLTFLAGAELDPDVFRRKYKEASVIGSIGFFVPFFICVLVARVLLHWDGKASLLSGIVLASTSVAVMYAVMLESGLNKTDYGKTLLAACFINDLITVLMLGFLFSPFTIKTFFFFAITIGLSVFSPLITSKVFRLFGNRPSEMETKYLLLFLFGLGGLATWAGSEAVLPAYVFGMALARVVGKNEGLIRRMRTMTLGLLTPFYFLRAGLLVSMHALLTGPFVILLLLLSQFMGKFVGIYPITKIFQAPRKEGMFTTLMMSTGLTFGTIAALFGLSHHVISQSQYSYLVAAVIGTAIIPTLIANRFFLPRHLLEQHALLEDEEIS